MNLNIPHKYINDAFLMTYLFIFVVIVVIFVVVFFLFWFFKGLKHRFTNFVILQLYKNKRKLKIIKASKLQLRKNHPLF